MSTTASTASPAPDAPVSKSKYVALIAMLLAVAMTFIDQTVIAVASPDIQRDLGLSRDAGLWVVNGYLLALAAGFAFGGRLADVVGHKRTVLVGIVGFAVTSALCGAAPSGSAAEAWMGGVAHYFRDSAAASIVVAVKARMRETASATALQPATCSGV